MSYTPKLLDVDHRAHIVEHVAEFANEVPGSLLVETAERVLDYELTLKTVGALIERASALLEGGIAPSTEAMGRIRVLIQRACAMTRPINDARSSAAIAKDSESIDLFPQQPTSREIL